MAHFLDKQVSSGPVSNPAPPRNLGRGAFHRPGSAGQIYERQGALTAAREKAVTENPACHSYRQHYHVSNSGPTSTSERTAMSGNSANGSVTVRLVSNVNAKAPSIGSEEKTVNYDALFTEEARQRQLPGLRLLATAFNGLPDMIPLHGGLPPASAFPLSGIHLTLKDGSRVDITDPEEVMTAQQYNLTLRGHPSVLNWVSEHTKAMHSPRPHHQTMITGGSNYTIEILMRLFMEPGDSILCEEFTYPHLPESMVLPVGFCSVRVEIDEFGIIPKRLEETLEGMVARGERTPRLLYTIPVGQNPTGATQTEERKRLVYEICRRFDIIIIEDDPYYYLQYSVGEPPRGLKNLGCSYLSMDSDYRVCRLDTFSKVLAPGLRIGWLTAHTKVIDKALFHFHGVAMGACSMSQVIVGALLQSFGAEGFDRHVKDIQGQYSKRAGIISAAADKHLTGLADWAPVTAGMFLWLKLRGFEDASQILGELQDAKVIVVPGKLARHSGPGSKTPCPYIRLSFVTAPEHLLEPAIERLAGLLQKLQNEPKPPCLDSVPIDVPLDQGEVL